MKEEDILALLRDRDERGAAEFLRRYTPLMRYIVSPILPDGRDAEECISEIAARVWEKIDSFDPSRGGWTAWLTALARNTALNMARKTAAPPEELSEELPSPDATPEEALLRREREETLRKALSALPHGERVLFYRKYYYRQSTAQIARELGMTERAVEGRLYRLKKSLRAKLGGDRHE